ncbi:MAG: 3-keto-5-aminohexanoate cleavage protein, partial [Thermoanaerobaculia bacterium]
SVNMDEDGAVDVAELLLTRGVAVELGLPTIESCELMMRSGIWKRALRLLLEAQEQIVPAALANVAAMEEIINGCPLPRLLHGFDAMAWPLIAEAARRKWDTRVGLEDTLVLPDGSPARSNAQLVEAARSVIARIQHG